MFRTVFSSGLIFAVMLSTAGLVLAQAPDSLWHRVYGGASSDYGYSVDLTTDGGFIIAGQTYSFGTGLSDFYLVRTNSSGDTLWHRAYGTAGTDYARAARQTPDGGFIVVGMSDSLDSGDHDVYLVKTDSHGVASWTRRYGTPNGVERGNDICLAPDGGYLIAGMTSSFGHGADDGYLIKTDSHGNLLWQAVYGGTENEYFERMELTSDGGCILVGSTGSATPGWDLYVVRTRSDGDTLWTWTSGGTGTDFGTSGVECLDGGFAVVGTIYFTSASYQLFIIKLSSDGNTVWRRFYGGSGTDHAFGVRQVASDGGYVIVGYTNSYGAGDWDIYLLRTDASGDTLWTTTFGDSLREWGWDTELLTDGSLVISGSARSYGPAPDDAYLLKTQADPAGAPALQLTSSVDLRLVARPNPSASGISIECDLPTLGDVAVTIHDCLGREIWRLVLPDCAAGRHSIGWDGRDARGREVGAGVYFCRVAGGGRTATTKSIVLR